MKNLIKLLIMALLPSLLFAAGHDTIFTKKNSTGVSTQTVILASPTNGYVLSWDDTNKTYLWVAQSGGGGSFTSITGAYTDNASLVSGFALKANLASPTFTGTVTFPTPFVLGAISITTTAAQLNYLNTLSSNVQTQIDAKQDKTTSIGFGLDGGGSVIVTGSRIARVMKFACTITSWDIVADASGSVVCDIRKGTPSGGAVTTSTITASAVPALSSARTASSSTLTGWTTSVAAGDVLELVITGTPATCTQVAVNLNVTRL